MKKKLLTTLLFVAMAMCLFALAISAETAYVNSKGEQVEAGSADIAYEINVKNPFETGGNCNITEIYLYDTSITKIIIPAIKFTHSNGTEYDLSTYSYCRLAGGWGTTLPVYPISEKDTDTKTSLHTQITEIEFHVPVLGDGAGSYGNLAGYSALQKLSFFERAYEPQNKGGFLSGCTSLTEIHFYGQNNQLSGNFFCASLTTIVFHRGSTSVVRSCAMNAVNGKDCTIYLNNGIAISDETDPRLTWNRSGDKLKLVILVDDLSGYTAEEIISHETRYMAGNNKSDNNYKYYASVKTYCDFYGEHISYSEINPCVGHCEVCKIYNALPNPSHNISEKLSYDNGFINVGKKLVGCTNEGCTHGETTEIPALVTSKGYSQDSTSTAVVLGLTFNKDAIESYEKYLGTEISYGLIASKVQDDLCPLDVSGEAKEGAIKADFTGAKYSIFQLKITNIENKDALFHCSGYFIVGNDISYINGTTHESTSITVSYNNYTGKN